MSKAGMTGGQGVAAASAAGAGLGWLGQAWLWAGFAFLYLPVVLLVALSFNDSPLLSVWGGFSLRWYRALAQDEELLAALATSLHIALLAATAAVVLGTLAAFVMDRYRRFRGRALFLLHMGAPLVVPEVITGLSLLLFFLACEGLLGGTPLRGLPAIWAGHTSICTAYAAVVIQARLAELDRSTEEAAMDLGCRPLGVFWRVILPAIRPSLVSAWLLTFTISLDDVVSTQFLMLPGTTTLPVLIFARARLGLDPSINAVGTLTVAVVGAALVAATLAVSYRGRLHARERAQALREVGADA
jgi:putrescine transport system permease protein